MDKQTFNNYYFKQGVNLMSGINLPLDKDGVCRNVRFINCDFHPNCDEVKFEDCEFIGCEQPKPW